MTYQIGKIQILKFLSDAKLDMGASFDLRRFNDFLMENGNIPISLLRYEYLSKEDELDKIWGTIWK